MTGGTCTKRMPASPGSQEPRSGAGPAFQPPPARPVTSLDLGPFDTAVPCARTHARSVVTEWSCKPDAVECVELVVSELVTNAIQATRRLHVTVPRAVRLRLTDLGPAILVEVADAEPVPPRLQRAYDDSEGGRGLMIVEALCTEWGAYANKRGGKVVWGMVSKVPA
jgi:anti-sigma regulatory factor (Ser/Thr protein kinase)